MKPTGILVMLVGLMIIGCGNSNTVSERDLGIDIGYHLSGRVLRSHSSERFAEHIGVTNTLKYDFTFRSADVEVSEIEEISVGEKYNEYDVYCTISGTGDEMRETLDRGFQPTGNKLTAEDIEVSVYLRRNNNSGEITVKAIKLM